MRNINQELAKLAYPSNPHRPHIFPKQYNSMNFADLPFLASLNAAAPFDDADLKAYWKFNEASGDIINLSESAADLGSAADIQIVGATYGATGILGDALSFDGVNDIGTMGTSLSQWNFMHNQSAKFTVIIWIKQGATGSANQDQLISTLRGGGGDIGTVCQLEAAASSLRAMSISIGTGTGFEGSVSVGTARMTDDTNWHMLMYKYDESLSSANAVMSFDDGVVETFNKSLTKTNSNSNKAMTCFAQPPATSLWTNGLADEISIWNRILTTDEVTELYNAGAALAIY